MLGELSAKYESNGDMATISTGAGDLGGKSYGCYQFSSTMGVVDSFVQYLGEGYPEYHERLVQHEVGTSEFDSAWLSLALNDSEGFFEAAHNYTKEVYYDVACSNLLDAFGIEINERSEALKNVVWSAAVQFSAKWIVELFEDAAKLAGKDIDEMLDADWIYWTYEVRLTDMSWSSGSPSLRPGLFNRWNNERTDALEMLEKELTSDGNF